LEAANVGRVTATTHQRVVGVSHVVRPRTLIYAGLWALIGVIMLVSLMMRDRLDINVLPDRNPLFVTLSDGAIRNGYTIKILNMQNELRSFSVSLDGLPGATLWEAGTEPDGGRGLDFDVEPDRLREIKVFVSQPREAVQHGATRFSFVLADRDGSQRTSEAAEFMAPDEHNGNREGESE